jgi:hypothetical protein
MKINKVEIYDEFVIKHNVAGDSRGLERIFEILGINFRRELRVYNYYNIYDFHYLLIPKLLEKDSNYIKIQRLIGNNEKIEARNVVPSLKEFLMMGANEKKIGFFDFLSSPAVSVLRGSLYGVLTYGPKLHFKIITYILRLILSFKYHGNVYLIHKDLNISQNCINTVNGVYFYDFGSSVLTKRYFLTDVIELSIDFEKLEFELSATLSLLQSLGFDNEYNKIATMQIQVILYRRFLHLHSRTRNDAEYMKKVKSFVHNITNIVIG